MSAITSYFPASNISINTHRVILVDKQFLLKSIGYGIGHMYSIMPGHSLTYAPVALAVEEPHPEEILPTTFPQYLRKKRLEKHL